MIPTYFFSQHCIYIHSDEHQSVVSAGHFFPPGMVTLDYCASNWLVVTAFTDLIGQL